MIVLNDWRLVTLYEILEYLLVGRQIYLKKRYCSAGNSDFIGQLVYIIRYEDRMSVIFRSANLKNRDMRKPRSFIKMCSL